MFARGFGFALACFLSLCEMRRWLVNNFQENRAPHVVLCSARGVICRALLKYLIILRQLVPNVFTLLEARAGAHQVAFLQ